MNTKETLIAATVAGLLVATPVVVSAKTTPVKDGKTAATAPAAQAPQGSAPAAKTSAPAKAPMYPEAKPLSPVTLRGAGAVK